MLFSLILLAPAPSVRAQGSLGWPEWLQVGGLELAQADGKLCIFFSDPTHAVVSDSLGGRPEMYYISNAVGLWLRSTLPGGFSCIRSIRPIQGKLYAATNGPDAIMSTDGGIHWRYTGLNLNDANDIYADGTGQIRALRYPMETFARLDTANCIATGSGNIYRSTDGGLNWRSVVSNGNAISEGVFADRCHGVYVCPNSWGTAYRSTDFGVTWKTVITGSGPYSERMAGASSVVYITDTSGMYRSTDDGLTWNSVITVNSGPHQLFAFGPMGEHVVIDWWRQKHLAGPYFATLNEIWMSSTGGDDMLHSGVNMTDSNGAPLQQGDSASVPLRLLSTCNTIRIPVPFWSDVDSMSEDVSILRDSLGDFYLPPTSTIHLRRAHEDTLWLSYNPHHSVSALTLQIKNHWQCAEWSETRSVQVIAMPAAGITPPPVFASSCKSVRQAALLQIDSCQTLIIDSVGIPPALRSRFSYSGALPDTGKMGTHDSLFFTWNPTDTLGTISDSVVVYGHYPGMDSAMMFWDYGHAAGMDTNYGFFFKTVPVKLFALPSIALLALDTVVAFKSQSPCATAIDTSVTFTNYGCTRDTIRSIVVQGSAYQMDAYATPLIVPPDSAITIKLHFVAPDTGLFTGSLDLDVVSGDHKAVTVPFRSIVLPKRGILDLGSRNIGAGDLSICGADTVVTDTIWNRGCTAIALRKINMTSDGSSGNPAFTLSTGATLPDTTIPPQSFILLTSHFHPHWKQALSALVTFEAQDVSGGTTLLDTIKLSGVGRPGTLLVNLQDGVAPRDFGTVYLCASRDTMLSFSNFGCDTVHIDSVRVTDVDPNFNPSFIASAINGPDILPGTPGIIQVRVSPAANLVSRSVSEIVTVYTNATNGRVFRIPISANNIVPQKLSLSLANAGMGTAGRTVPVSLLLKGDRTSLTSIHFSISNDDDLLGYQTTAVPGLTLDSVHRLADGHTRVRYYTISPVPSSDTIAILTYIVHLAPSLTTPLALSDITSKNILNLSGECLAEFTASSSTFNYGNDNCGDSLLRYYMNYGTLTLQTIHPNPAEGQIAFSYSATGDKASKPVYQIVDELGKTMLRGELESTFGTASVDVSHLPSGRYVLTLISPSGKRSEQFVVKH